MALVLADRVKETTTTVGTGAVTLLGAPSGFQTFAVVGNANTTYYAIVAQTGSEWEVGVGTYTASGTTLSRTTVLANSSGTQPTALTFSAGTKDVFVTYPAAYSVNSTNNSGTSGQFLKTNGSGVAPTWTSVTATTVSDTVNTSTGYFQLPQGLTSDRPGTPANGMMRINTTTNVLEVYSTNNSLWNTVASFSSYPTSIELLIVAGGGGGGLISYASGRSAGGGAGGLLYYGAETPKTPNGSAISITSGVSYAITVGGGGAACQAASPDGNGSNSAVTIGSTTYTSIGGGGGGYNDGVAGHVGGSGGGGWYTGVGGAGTSNQGNTGGDGGTVSRYGGGGGGGSGAVGGNGNTVTGGNGGNGLAYVISGTSTYYAGGGSGDVWPGTGGSTSPGTAGLGGGGTGNNFTGGTNGTVNTGGGGGSGADATHGLGGSGVVILRYPDTYIAATSTTGSPTITVSGGYRVYKFTASGSITF